MEDPQVRHDDDSEEERRRREEEMEQLLWEQEHDDDQGENNHNNVPQDDPNHFLADDNQDNGDEHNENIFQDPRDEAGANFHDLHAPPSTKRLSYVQASLGAAVALIYYALRTRQQWYLAIVYLSSSKWAYIVFGNALIATCMSVFSLLTRTFLNGLRLQEAEGLSDFFRWHVTETCLALTMFRSELDVRTGVLFLILVLGKCLHFVADARESTLRMTEDAIVVGNGGWPAIPIPQVKLLLFMFLLQFLDVIAVVHCGEDIVTRGPSVSILFAFEAAIMLASVVSNILLWHLHLIDSLLQHVHETSPPNTSRHMWIHPWNNYKATLVFAVEVQAQAAKFSFYVTFFAIVMTYYGMPINLFREVYLSFQQLKQRLVAFSKYRGLMASMNRFPDPTDEELEDAGRICIICRDAMTIPTSKKLPGCGHTFHKSCLREWLVQQQSCPTCRGDIAAMEARERQQQNAVAAAQAREVQEQAGDADAQDDDAAPHGQAPVEEEAETHPQTPQTSMNVDRNRREGIQVRQEAHRDEHRRVHFRQQVEVRVRETPVQNEPELMEEASEQYAFPAFYRISNDSGCPVWNNGESVSFATRDIPFGVVVLVSGMAWRTWDGENRLMLRIPDGWLLEDDAVRIHAVQFPNKDVLGSGGAKKE